MNTYRVDIDFLYMLKEVLAKVLKKEIAVISPPALTDKLASLLSRSVGNYIEPQCNSGACRQMMLSIARRVDAGLAAAVRDKAAKEAEELCASGQCAAALPPLQLAVDLGHLPSRALKAWMLLEGREGVARDENGAFELVEEGARLGCHHCQGVMAECYMNGFGCVRDEERSVELARESSGSGLGSRYGQCVLGKLYHWGEGGVARDYAQALALYRLAAAQKLDGAQYCLGFMYSGGCGVAKDHAEALRWYRLAAAQGHPWALFSVAECHEFGRGVPTNKPEAIRWYRRTLAAGCPFAEYPLQRLCA